MDDTRKRIGELIESLAASRPGQVDVPIEQMNGLGHGAMLDNATELLKLRDYELFKVRVEGAAWIASYRLRRRAGGN